MQIPTNALRDSDQQAIRTAASMTPSARTPPTVCSSLSRGDTTDHRTETPGTRTPAARTARRGLLPRRVGAQTYTSGFASHRGIPREASELAPTNTRSPLPNAWTARRRARATVIQVRHGVSRRRVSSTRTYHPRITCKKAPDSFSSCAMRHASEERMTVNWWLLICGFSQPHELRSSRQSTPVDNQRHEQGTVDRVRGSSPPCAAQSPLHTPTTLSLVLRGSAPEP